MMRYLSEVRLFPKISPRAQISTCTSPQMPKEVRFLVPESRAVSVLPLSGAEIYPCRSQVDFLTQAAELQLPPATITP